MIIEENLRKFPLRSFQGAVMQTVKDKIANNESAILIQMPVGSGKTAIALASIELFLSMNRNRRVIIVCPGKAIQQYYCQLIV